MSGSPDGSGQMVVNEVSCLTGNVTTLNLIGSRPAPSIESMLGFRARRLLSGGYFVALLVRPLVPEDFQFDGTTLNSGGRLGPPPATQRDDRPFVHDEMLKKYGPEHVRKLQAMQTASIIGERRIAKVCPVERHKPDGVPSIEYPMGGGGLQWKLIRPVPFLIAMFVAPDGMATLPMETLSLAESLPFQELYFNRSKVARYLQTARVDNVDKYCRS